MWPHSQQMHLSETITLCLTLSLDRATLMGNWAQNLLPTLVKYSVCDTVWAGVLLGTHEDGVCSLCEQVWPFLVVLWKAGRQCFTNSSEPCLSQQLPGEGILAKGSAGEVLLVMVLLTGHADLLWWSFSAVEWHKLILQRGGFGGNGQELLLHRWCCCSWASTAWCWVSRASESPLLTTALVEKCLPHFQWCLGV